MEDEAVKSEVEKSRTASVSLVGCLLDLSHFQQKLESAVGFCLSVDA